MSIQQNFPNTRPSLNLNFARSQKLDPRITFTRTSSATRVNSDGLIEVVPANSPRFDFDPISGECLGLLIEEQRSNLLIGSDYSSNNALSNVTLTLNATTAPDGTNTAVSMDGESSVSNVKYMYKGRSTNTTGSYVTSVFLKYKSERFIVLRMNDNTGVNGVLQRIDILNGTFTNAVETGGTLTNASSTITPYPNGWYKISVSGTFNDALTQVQGAQVLLTTFGTTTSTNGVYMWGAQLEQGSFPTSYIPTTNTTVTRTADNASITGTNFNDFYNQSEGTIIAKHKTFLTPNPFNRVWAITNDGNIDTYAIYYPSSNTRIDALKRINSTNNFVTGSSITNSHNIFNNTALSYNDNGISLVSNGGNIGDYIISGRLNPTKIFIGLSEINIGNYVHLSQLTYYPKRLPNAQLINLTK